VATAGVAAARIRQAIIVRNGTTSNFLQHLDMSRALSQCSYDTGYHKAIPPDYQIAENAANPEKSNRNRAIWDRGGRLICLCPNHLDTGVITGI
jgi:hypothetical protein